MMDSSLAGRTVVVTGASKGIGAACAHLAAERGAKVAACDVDDEGGHQLAGSIRGGGGVAEYVHMDVAKEAEVVAGLARVREKLGPIYGLVNNAGISGVNKPTHAIDEADWDRVIAVNVKGVFLCTKHAVLDMLRNRSGSIVNLSSIYGLVGAPDVPAYHASKGAVRLMTKTDALLYVKDGIRVNSVHPGFIETPMVQNHARSLGDPAAVYEQIGRLHPMGRLGSAKEIAEGVAFLLSDAASFVTGSELVIDGGYTCQ